MTIAVIKVGGSTLSTPDILPQLAEAIRAYLHPCVLVHGGGKAITTMLDKTGVQPTFIEGQRVTDATTIDTVEMVLSGQVNKAITRAMLVAGLDAIGLSGVDRGLLRVERWSDTMSRVGRVIEVRTEVLTSLCAQQVLPIVSPIALGPDGSYNVNADHAAGAIASALSSEDVVFLTDVQGIMVDGTLKDRLTAQAVDHLIKDEIINGGMIPKVRAGLTALEYGAAGVRITNIEGLSRGAGTTLTLT